MPTCRMSPREPIFPLSWSSAIHLARRPDPSSRSIRETGDAANGRSVFSLPSGLTSALATIASRRPAANRPSRERTFGFRAADERPIVSGAGRRRMVTKQVSGGGGPTPPREENIRPPTSAPLAGWEIHSDILSWETSESVLCSLTKSSITG